MMDLYYPNRAWLCLEREAFDRLHEYKRRRGIPTFEQTVEELVAMAGPPGPVAEATHIEAATTIGAAPIRTT